MYAGEKKKGSRWWGGGRVAGLQNTTPSHPHLSAFVHVRGERKALRHPAVVHTLRLAEVGSLATFARLLVSAIVGRLRGIGSEREGVMRQVKVQKRGSGKFGRFNRLFQS